MTPATPFSGAVCIGRFQGLHFGQLAVIREALALAPRVAVVIGSAFQARTPKNPFTWQERAEMIRLTLSPAERERTQFVPVRDYYDSARWTAEVRRLVLNILGGLPAGQTVLVGHLKDATSDYLHQWPDWQLHDVGLQGNWHSTTLRDAFFGAAHHDLEPALAALVSLAPPTTLGFLRAWARLPAYQQLAAEWTALRAEKALWAHAPYPPMFVTVDVVIECANHVLLIVRDRAPGKGLYALPGGFLETRESVYQSALRELQEETCLHLSAEEMSQAFRSVRVFDHPDRSQRGRVITHAHHFHLGQRGCPEVRGSDDASAAIWMPVNELNRLEDCFHDDHFHILDRFLHITI